METSTMSAETVRDLATTKGGCCTPSCCEPGDEGVTLRPARQDDLSGILRLLGDARLPGEGVAEGLEPGYVVAETGGELVGAAGVEAHGPDGLLRSVVVTPALRGKGLGEALTRDRTRWAREAGLDCLWLLTTTAAPFFRRLGFEERDREKAPVGIRSSSEFRDLCPSTATVMELPLAPEEVRAARALEDEVSAARAIKDEVRERYGAAARAAAAGTRADCGCGGSGGCGTADAPNPITRDLYDEAQTSGLPQEAILASLGCGNPTALATLEPGEIVLDLGSGGGIDVLLSARRVGPTGKAWGLDMTDEMLELARENQRKARVENAEFLKGDMEDIPLPDGSVDVVISNCVINLAADKGRVLREAHRVLRPGGRFAVSDIVVRGPVPPEIRRSMELWVGCVAGALDEEDYRRLMAEAGFRDVEIEPTRVYSAEDARAFLESAGIEEAGFADAVDGRFMSAFVRGRKGEEAGP
jgi:arsenite methyltransferase